jgi:hypothetical protein
MFVSNPAPLLAERLAQRPASPYSNGEWDGHAALVRAEFDRQLLLDALTEVWKRWAAYIAAATEDRMSRRRSSEEVMDLWHEVDGAMDDAEIIIAELRQSTTPERGPAHD